MAVYPFRVLHQPPATNLIPEQSVVFLSHRHSLSSISLGHADAVSLAGNSLNFFASTVPLESSDNGMLQFKIHLS
jgi:hypothetical protein